MDILIKVTVLFALAQLPIATILAISPRQADSLRPEQYNELDFDVKRYFEETYEELDSRNVSFDEQLYRSIRSIRHTIVIQHNEFYYTSEQYKQQAMGPLVDRHQCKQQLFLLAEIAKKMAKDQADGLDDLDVPLSITNFVDSSARAEAGVLNGNFVWLGSHSSCVRARIPSEISELYLTNEVVENFKEKFNQLEQQQQQQPVARNSHWKASMPDIKGRYCVSHMRAKSWPKWDIYFEDRITIRKGICLPEPCHTAIYEQDEEIQQLIDYLTRKNLPAPYSRDDRYETSSLYCLPDEDSPYRQWDLGAKLFVAFVIGWALITLWFNRIYYQRRATLQKLRETIDIRMIIDTKRDELSSSSDDNNDEEEERFNAVASRANKSQSALYNEIVQNPTIRLLQDEQCKSSPIDNNQQIREPQQQQHQQQTQRKQEEQTQKKGDKSKGFLHAGAKQLKKQFALASDTITITKANNTSPETSTETPTTTNTDNKLQTNDAQTLDASNPPSLVNTPLPSDIEETDVEFISMFRSDLAQQQQQKKKREKKIKPSANYTYEDKSSSGNIKDSSSGDAGDGGGGLDWVRAFSIEANFFALVSPRSTTVSTERDHKRDSQERQQNINSRAGSRVGSRSGSRAGVYAGSRGSQQLAAVPRRTSSSNDKLIKDLQQQDSGVAIVSKSELNSSAAGGSSKTRSRRVDIEMLDGLKVIATSYIVFGHTLMFFFGCVNDLRFASERMLDITMAATLNTLQVVSLFYIITGCLITYLSFSRTKPKQLLNPFFWLLVMFGRYFRLLPAYLVVFWFSRHVATHMGSGRDWYDYRTDVEHPRGFCGQESWWVMWTMSAADIKIPMDCLPQAWYLSDDFRTLLVLPFFIYLLARNVMLGYGAIFATVIYSTSRLVSVLRSANIDYKVMLAWQPHVYSIMADRLHDVYTDFYVRMSTYLLGVVVGHILYLYEIGRIKELPKLLRLIGMKLAICVGFVLYFGARVIANPIINQFLPSPESLTSDTVVLLIPIFKNTMEICLAILVLLLSTGGGSPSVRYLLSTQTMKILSNISYAVFLTHVEVMYKLPGIRFESSYWYLFVYAIYFIITTQVVSFLLHLFYEMPINYIIRHIFKKASKAVQ